VPTAEPSVAAPSAGATPAPSGSGSGTGSTDSTVLIVGIAALVAIIAVGLLAMRRRGTRAEEE